MWTRSFVGGLIVAGVIAAGAVIAVGAGVLDGSPAPLGHAADPLGFQPVDHCVVVDSRQPGAGGEFTAAEARSYKVTPEAGDFSAQGGSATGCGVPAGAPAALFSIKTERVSGQGRVEVYEHGGTANGSPVVNFDPSSFKDNAGATTRLCYIPPGLACVDDFTVSVPGQIGAKTHVIVTVLGYFEHLPAPASSEGAILGSAFVGGAANSRYSPLNGGTATTLSNANYVLSPNREVELSEFAVEIDVTQDANVVFTVLDDGVDTAVTCTITVGNTSCTSAGTATVAARSKLQLRTVTAGSPTNMNPGWSMTIS